MALITASISESTAIAACGTQESADPEEGTGSVVSDEREIAAWLRGIGIRTVRHSFRDAS